MKLNSTILSGAAFCIFFIVACNRSAEHRYNEKYVNEQKSVEQTTVLLNNSRQQIPLKNLQELKIASINFGSEQGVVFDSILNKYAPVTSFSTSGAVSTMPGEDDLNANLESLTL